MRGAEIRAVVAEHVTFDSHDSATLRLAATKADPAGRGSPHWLRCSCGHCTGPAHSRSVATQRLCPIWSLQCALRIRSSQGFSPKDLLFPTKSGQAPSHSDVVQTIRVVLRDSRASEHSLRRTGAQHWAGLGLGLREVQYLGRWGSPTDLRCPGIAGSAAAAPGLPPQASVVLGRQRARVSSRS